MGTYPSGFGVLHADSSIILATYYLAFVVLPSLVLLGTALFLPLLLSNDIVVRVSEDV
ncbi:hypothetical protein C345_00716 [Cryptococcus neoformans A2-102-5]|nr:hypothetical protein C345_00716 [Cryptococcus neoformans var. grubii A2-102-5]